jgi:NTE family protein
MSKLRIALALGSGGLRGIAHIGVLRALAEAEIQPTVYAGSSAGALVAAVAADDVSLSEMERIAARLHHKSLFQIDVLGLLRYGTGALSIYRSAPLRELCVELFGNRTFYDLRTPLLMSTVDVQSSAALWWGTAAPDVPVADAVCASCAMPGLLPPGLVSGRLCMDGSVLDPLALGAVAPLADLVIAIVLDGSAPAGRDHDHGCSPDAVVARSSDGSPRPGLPHAGAVGGASADRHPARGVRCAPNSRWRPGTAYCGWV